MNKTFANILCAFILSKRKRHEMRRKLLGKDILCLRPPHVIVGTGNKIIVVENGKEIDYTNIAIPNLRIEIHGNNNLIHIPDIKSFISNNFINLKSNNAEIRFGKSEEWFTSQDIYLKSYIGYRNLYVGTSYGNNQKVDIGNNIEISGATINMGESNCHLIIKDFCMLSNCITFQMSDAHSILDKNEKKVINKVTHPVIIGEHSWIARNVIFTKNANIAAKIIKRDVTWDHTPPSLWNDELKKGIFSPSITP